MHSLPYLLIGIRLALGLLLAIFCRNGTVRRYFPALFIAGVFTDYIDGLACHWLGGHYPLRINVWDGYADISIFAGSAVFIVVNHWSVIQRYRAGIAALIGIQCASWAYSLIKFGRMTTYHSYSAKVWSLIMLLAMLDTVFNKRSRLIILMLIAGFYCNVEEIAITHILPVWRNNIVSFGAAEQWVKEGAR